jgi:Trypsin-like peptidase domain
LFFERNAVQRKKRASWGAASSVVEPGRTPCLVIPDGGALVRFFELGQGRTDLCHSRFKAGKGIALAARNEIHIFGSGVVFDARRGLIITNSHIIDHADEITLTDGRALSARRVGADPETDVAVIQVRADGLTKLGPAIGGRACGAQAGDLVTELLRFLQGLHFRATTQQHLVWFQSPVQIECRMADRTLWHEAPTGSLAICPAGMDCAADAGQNVDAIIVAINPAKLALAAAEGLTPEAQLIERLCGHDEALTSYLVCETAHIWRPEHLIP